MKDKINEKMLRVVSWGHTDPTNLMKQVLKPTIQDFNTMLDKLKRLAIIDVRTEFPYYGKEIALISSKEKEELIEVKYAVSLFYDEFSIREFAFKAEDLVDNKAVEYIELFYEQVKVFTADTKEEATKKANRFMKKADIVVTNSTVPIKELSTKYTIVIRYYQIKSTTKKQLKGEH